MKHMPFMQETAGLTTTPGSPMYAMFKDFPWNNAPAHDHN
jgi:hypothetical protein